MSSIHAARVAVVFNASSPLARSLAMEFALQGFSLALTEYDSSLLEHIVDECFEAVKFSPFKVSAFEVDISEEESISACAQEVFREFGRLDVICFVETRLEEETMSRYRTIFNQHDHVVLTNEEDTDDFRFVLNNFYPLLKQEKPLPPPIHFIDNSGGRRRLPRGEVAVRVDPDDNDEEEDTSSTSLLLLVSTPDQIACRAGRYPYCSRVRALEAMVEGINAEAVLRGDRIRGCTAVVGTLDGELPFWRSKRREEDFQNLLKRQQTRIDVEVSVVREVSALSSQPSSSRLEQVQAMIASRLGRRRASRSRGLPVEPVEMIDEKEEEVEDIVHGRHQEDSVPNRLTPESLTHTEASAWIMWGLSRGRFKIFVGYDVLLLESAWLPNEFLNRLFAFSGPGGRRNLLPVRTKELSLVKSTRLFDPDGLRRHRTRQVVVFVPCLFAVFTPVVAVFLVLFTAVWSAAVMSKEGHSVTERAVSSLLYVVSVRRRHKVKLVWDVLVRIERGVFGTIANAHKRIEDVLFWRKPKEKIF